MLFTGPVETFFKPPDLEPSPEGDHILFHLRRDLVRLYGREGEYSGIATCHAMLAMIGILTGIDYLARIYSTHQGPRKSRKRFVDTVRELCNGTIDDAEMIYQFRCALVHSVALSIISDSYRKPTRFIFEISDSESVPLIQKLSDTGSEVTSRISFRKLKKAFLEIVSELEEITRNVHHPRNAHVVNMIGHMHSEKILQA